MKYLKVPEGGSLAHVAADDADGALLNTWAASWDGLSRLGDQASLTGTGSGRWLKCNDRVSACMHRVKKKTQKIGCNPRPRRASATAPLRTGADLCKTGACAGSSAGTDTGLTRRQSNHEWTDDQIGRRRFANTHADGGSQVHAADDTPSTNAAASARHCDFTRQGG